MSSTSAGAPVAARARAAYVADTQVVVAEAFLPSGAQRANKPATQQSAQPKA
jgi:hypothetical protein